MFGKDLVNFAFASASGEGKIAIFAPQVSTYAYVKFLSRVKSFTKIEFGWVKYW